jgi:hypothetical protein
VPFVYVEWKCEQLSILLEQWAFLEILGHAGRLSIIVAVIFYFAESRDRQKAKHYQAWQVINSAQGKPGSGGRIDALQDLHKDGVSLDGVDISNANLDELNLVNAMLNNANLSGADLYKANLSVAYLIRANLTSANLDYANLSDTFFDYANLFGADLSGAYLLSATLPRANLNNANLSRADFRLANLSGANLMNIRNWQEIKDIENANVYGVKNSPVGFIEWAKEHGAVSIESHEKWLDFLDEKRKEMTKEKLRK